MSKKKENTEGLAWGFIMRDKPQTVLGDCTITIETPQGGKITIEAKTATLKAVRQDKGYNTWRMRMEIIGIKVGGPE